MPLLTVADQGYFTPGQIIQEVAARMLQQRQTEQQMSQRQQQFVIEQRQRQAQAAIDEANAANTPTAIALKNRAGQLGIDQISQEISQGKDLFPSRLRIANTGASTAETNLAQLQATNPLNLRLLGAHATNAEEDLSQRKILDPLAARKATAETNIAEQNAIPTDEDTTSTTDALGNLTEKTTKTKGGQPFGSASKVMRGNRPLGATGGATKIEYVKDPITGEVTQTLVTRVDPTGQMIQNVIPSPGGKLDPTKTPPGGAVRPAVPTPGKPAPTNSPSPAPKKASTFADLKVGDEFMQGGTRYRKTGEKTAEPVASPAVAAPVANP